MNTKNTADKTNHHQEVATFAGGCFWCMEPIFKINGVNSVVVGYAGGKSNKPSYEQVSLGQTGHKEAVQLQYNPKLVPYSTLLKIYLQNIDPTDPGGQFADRGPQYQTAIFYHNQTQKAQAITALQKLRDSGRFNQPLRVQVLPYKNFYPAEDYHQSYYLKHPIRYQMYKKGSGREEFLARAENKSH